MIEVTKQTVDVDRILRSKMGSKARLVPRFLVNWLKNTIHQDIINDFLWKAKDEVGTPWLKRCISYLNNEIEVVGKENLPDDSDGKRYTFVCNHPLGAIDGVSVGAVIGERYNDNFRYLVNDMLMNLPGLAPLCIPINKTGKEGRDFPKMVEAVFGSEHHVVMFPAGICSRKKNGVIRDLPWKKTFISKSIKTHRDIVPIFFDGRNSDRFYRIANIGDRLKMKFTIATLWLPDEMFRNSGKKFTIYIGKPISWQTFDKSKTASEWAQYVQDVVYKLKV
ncbi:MAG: glycerol acyltransferase [Prevotella sp.]|nr:glycerol acyltransferase [Prevotella sp.]MBR4651601.1 glycerol acyltransferase [Prevotella sp.]